MPETPTGDIEPKGDAPSERPAMTSEMEPGNSDPVAELVRRLEPRLKQILVRFRIPVADAEAMLEDCLMVLLYRQEQIAQPDRWLQRSLRYRCVRHWRGQQRRLCRMVDGELVRWLEDEAVSSSERSGRRRLLDAEIARLPQPCQAPLRGRFGLGAGALHDLPAAASPPFDAGSLDGEGLPVEVRAGRDPYVRSLTRLMRQMVDNGRLDVDGLKILAADPPSP
ncbi:MAG: hypothetical protein KDD11_17020 [Acidobacteria bacterium]|nr:hypothetical protein [Acidobacteriota bacterium]